MTSTTINVGIDGRKSCRVLKPPGGGAHSDIFGLSQENGGNSGNRHQKQFQKSNISECFAYGSTRSQPNKTFKELAPENEETNGTGVPGEAENVKSTTNGGTIETSASIEALALIEPSAPVEEPAPVEESVPVEVPEPVEVPAPVEIPTPVEVPVPVEAPVPVEIPAPALGPGPAQVPVPPPSQQRVRVPPGGFSSGLW